MARAILHRRKTNERYYFPGHLIDDHFKDGSWGKFKKELDKRSGVTGWQVTRPPPNVPINVRASQGPARDCRDNAQPRHGRGKTDLDEIYDRYEYLEEKRDALAKLERHLMRLIA